MDAHGRTTNEVIARLATRMKGVATREALLAAGVTRNEIRRRLESGALFVEFRGVYRVGHRAPSLETHYLAAVLACGQGALLAGRAAAYIHGLLRHPPSLPVVLTYTERRIPGVKTRRARRGIDPADATTRNGMPITTVPRTLVDLAAELNAAALARACHEAGVKYRTTPAHVDAVLARRPHTKGARTLRAILRGDLRVTLSRMEARFLTLLGSAKLPLPITNKPAGAHRVDCRWPDHRLTVELDSYQFHNTRHAWEQDRRREREARARGDQHRRYTWADVFEHPEPMLVELTALLRTA
jgi:very-short-patch-repair endonuclease